MGSSRERATVISAAALLALSASAAPVFAQDDAQPDYLARIQEQGRIVMSTDALYPPQSYIDEDTGELVGFDIDVGAEIADRLGVQFVAYPTTWDSVTSGRWAGRWDFSVGSMTITVPRKEKLDFTRPYYTNPVVMSVVSDTGFTSMDDLAAQTICVGEATTYLDWLNGQLDLGDVTDEYVPADSVPPEGATVVTRTTDRDCANEWGAGRRDFQGWLTSAATTQAAIDDGIPITIVDDLVFNEPLAAAFDNSIEDNDSLVAAVDQIIADMHADGTLTDLSMKWFGEDLTQPQQG
jgi:polar amino acid transport system substrate-binding protein